MIRGHKPAAYFVTGDGTVKVEGEQHQCVHCQFLWNYKPGSGIRRGYCMKCDGWLCGRSECEEMQRAMLSQFNHLGGATDRHCIPYNDYVNRQRDELLKTGKWEATGSGILIAKS